MNRHIILFTIACGMLLLTTTNIAFGQLKVKGSVGKVHWTRQSDSRAA